MAGAISCARDIVPYFSRVYSSPATVPGTADREVAARAAFRNHVALRVEIHVGVRRERRGLAKVDEGLAPVGELHRHEAAAAEIAGRRIHHRQCVADRHRRIDGIAAVPQHLDADARGMLPAP